MTAAVRRLAGQAQFLRVYREGLRHASPLVVIHARPNDTGAVSVGLAVSRRFGGAVARNHLRRRLREAVRMAVANATSGADLVVTPRPAATRASVAELANAVGAAIRALGLTEPSTARPRKA